MGFKFNPTTGTLDIDNVPVLTVGSVVFASSIGLTQDNTNFFWDDTNNRLGIGTAAPISRLSIADDGVTPNTALVTSEALTFSSQALAIGLTGVVANDGATARPVFKGVKARGTLTTPTIPVSGDSVLSLLGAIYDGVTTQATGVITFTIDGSVSSGVAPQKIGFLTSATSGAARTEKLTIRADGSVGINNTSAVNKLNVNSPVSADSLAQVLIGAGAADRRPLVVQGFTSQTENLQVWENSAGTALTRISSTGSIVTNNGNSPNILANPSADAIPIIARGFSSQTLSLQEWQDSTTAVKVRVSAAGSVVAGGRGIFGTSTVLTNVDHQFFSSIASSVTAVVRGFASQAAALTEWQNDTGTVLATVNSSGDIKTATKLSSGVATSTSLSGIANLFGAGAASNIGVVIRGAASQSGDYLSIQDSTSATLAKINSSGSFYLPTLQAVVGTGPYLDTNSGSGLVIFNRTTASLIPLTVRGMAAQSGFLQQWQDSSPTNLALVSSSGSIRSSSSMSAGNITGLGSQLSVSPTATGTVGIIVRGFSGQTGDLTQWQDSGTNILAKIDSSGRMGATDLASFYVISATNRLNNISASSASTTLGFNPIPKYLWHDLLSFNKHWGTPTFEIFTGSWGAGTLDSNLFNQKENQTITVINGTTQTAARWTWNTGNVSFAQVSAWMIGVTFQSTPASKDYLIESSADGSVWTTRHTSTANVANQQPVFLHVADNSGDAFMRLTITVTNSQPLVLASVKALTARWGNQGGGSELEKPYTWDASQNIAFGTSAVAGTNVVTIGTSTTTAAGGMKFGADTVANFYRSAASTIKTDGNITIAGNLVLTGVGAYGTVQDEGTPLTQRNTINFVGAGITAADSGGVTTVTVPGTAFPLVGSGAAVGTDMLTVDVTADTQRRFILNADGKLEWGSGALAVDTNIYRGGANLLQTDDTLQVQAPAAANNGIIVKQFSGSQSGALLVATTSAGAQLAAIEFGGQFTTKVTSGTANTDGSFYATPSAGSSYAFACGTQANTRQAFTIDATGAMLWGTGNIATDTKLYRSAADTLKTDDNLIIGFNGGKTTLTLSDTTANVGITIATDTNLYRSAADSLATDDDLLINLAGKGLRVKEGTNAKMGTATLVAGTATVSTTAVTATSRIFLTSQVDGGTPGFIRVSARNAGTDFTITGIATDTSTIAWFIVEPA